MRNWNHNICYDDIYCNNEFLLYLWGIETYVIRFKNFKKKSFYFTYEELKQDFVAYLLLYSEKFLLYLWGIETRIWREELQRLSRFYFTYEELKRKIIKINNQTYQSFYFTYEELKHDLLIEHQELVYSFYFTYEELKLSNVPIIIPNTCVFTLPMRNWNNSDFPSWTLLITEFLLYLWGIET